MKAFNSLISVLWLSLASVSLTHAGPLASRATTPPPTRPFTVSAFESPYPIGQGITGLNLTARGGNFYLSPKANGKALYLAFIEQLRLIALISQEGRPVRQRRREDVPSKSLSAVISPGRRVESSRVPSPTDLANPPLPCPPPGFRKDRTRLHRHLQRPLSLRHPRAPWRHLLRLCPPRPRHHRLLPRRRLHLQRTRHV